MKKLGCDGHDATIVPISRQQARAGPPTICTYDAGEAWPQRRNHYQPTTSSRHRDSMTMEYGTKRMMSAWNEMTTDSEETELASEAPTNDEDRVCL